jgi:hypothetical protein
MLKRLLLLSLLLVAPLVSGCLLDESARAEDVSCIPVGSPVGHGSPEVDPLVVGSAGPLSRLVAPGRAMPGGGTFKGLAGRCATTLNDAGQHAFVAVISEGGATLRAAYRLDGDGRLSLILKEGMTIDSGTIKHLVPSKSCGIGLNDQGQVALPAQLDNDGPMVILLTPTAS